MNHQEPIRLFYKIRNVFTHPDGYRGHITGTLSGDNHIHRTGEPGGNQGPLTVFVNFGSCQGRNRLGTAGVAALRRGRTGAENAGRGQKAPLPADDYQPHVR